MRVGTSIVFVHVFFTLSCVLMQVYILLLSLVFIIRSFIYPCLRAVIHVKIGKIHSKLGFDVKNLDKLRKSLSSKCSNIAAKCLQGRCDRRNFRQEHDGKAILLSSPRYTLCSSKEFVWDLTVKVLLSTFVIQSGAISAAFIVASFFLHHQPNCIYVVYNTMIYWCFQICCLWNNKRKSWEICIVSSHSDRLLIIHIC